jgi:hypothetical protein
LKPCLYTHFDAFLARIRGLRTLTLISRKIVGNGKGLKPTAKFTAPPSVAGLSKYKLEMKRLMTARRLI